jgi:hypothetical protein
MLRWFYAFLILIGLVVGVLSAFLAFDEPNRAAPSAETAPVTLTRSLTPGVWSIYEQAGTGPFGTPLPVATTVTGPGDNVLAVGIPSDIITLRTHGQTFAEAATVRIAEAGTYEIQLTPQNGTLLRVLLTRVPHPRFPWNALAIDGLVVLAVGLTFLMRDGRRRQQLPALEMADAHP